MNRSQYICFEVVCVLSLLYSPVFQTPFSWETNKINDTKKKMASETVTDGCEERQYFETQDPIKQRQDNFKTMYRLLFLYSKIGCEGEGEVVENMLKSKRRHVVSSLCLKRPVCQFS